LNTYMGACGPYFGVSLFSGAGIGDTGWRAAGVPIIATCEIEPDRSALTQLNFPDASHFTSDVWSIRHEYCRMVRQRLREAHVDELFLVSCTAPCQGMSKSGQGTLLRNIREGKRPKLDPRNRLILPALDIIVDLRPRWVVFENVVEMRSTLIEDAQGQLRPILDIIRATLGEEYQGEAYDVEFADFGIPQRRMRLVTVFTRDVTAKHRLAQGVQLIPPRTHSATGQGGKHRWISVSQALADFPQLDSASHSAARCKSVPFHYVPVLDPKKYEWIRHTKPGSSAFDNQCINPECLYEGNATHGTKYEEGINRASRSTPLFCERCGALLPRPYTLESDGSKRIMSGFTSAYKRMAPDQPAPALTRNLSYPCSDNKIHPYQNRVLSLAEAMTLQTVAKYTYKWGPLDTAGKTSPVATDALIRLVIGESVPPAFFEQLGAHLQMLTNDGDLPDHISQSIQPKQLALL